MSLVARHLETLGFVTVVIGSARDIVEQCAVSRFLFSDFPLGHPCGLPGNRAMQQTVVSMALDLAERAFAPQTTVQTPFQFPDDGWRNSYMAISGERREELAAEGEERRRRQAERKTANT